MNGECPKTGKVRYATARAAHEFVQHARWTKGTKVLPRRVYFCKHCQGYHLSSKGDVWGRRERLADSQKRQNDDEDTRPNRPR